VAETPTRLVTADELLRMPENGCRRELRQGVIVELSPTGRRHGRDAVRLAARLEPYVDERRLGAVYVETGYRLSSDPDTVRGPDVSFVRRERVDEGDEPEGFWTGPPDLAAEFVSPSESADSLQEKIAEYLAAGTRLVWVFYARTRHVVVWRADRTTALLGADDVLSGEDVIPGFTCPVREIFGS
jgi:Uma2 family endonuclease